MTVAELLVVFMVLAVVLSFAVPLWWRTGRQLDAAAAGLASVIREARTLAIVEGYRVYIVFYQHNGRYKVETPGETAWHVLPEGVSFAGNNFPLELDGRPTLSFRYTGAPNAGGHVTLRDRADRRRYVIVSPVTGRVRVDKAPP